MPLQLVDGNSSEEGDSEKLDTYLEQVLEFQLPGPSGEIVLRKRVGIVSHTFSHIQLTLRVQLLVLQARRTPQNCALLLIHSATILAQICLLANLQMYVMVAIQSLPPFSSGSHQGVLIPSSSEA